MPLISKSGQGLTGKVTYLSDAKIENTKEHTNSLNKLTKKINKQTKDILVPRGVEAHEVMEDWEDEFGP